MTQLSHMSDNFNVDFEAKLSLILTHLRLEGYKPDVALRIAETQAEEWYKHRNSSKRDSKGNILYVMPHPDGWIVQRPLSVKYQSEFVYETCDAATECALKIAKQKRYHVIAFYENGEVSGRYYQY